MKRPVYLVLVLLLFACGQKTGKTPATGNTSLPSEKTTVEFTEEMHRFGELTAGEIVVATFEFTNTGTADFVIESVDADCGCLTAHFPQNPVKPGQKGRIEVEFDSSGMFGRQFKTIEINGNSKELKHLAIFADVKNEILEIQY